MNLVKCFCNRNLSLIEDHLLIRIKMNEFRRKNNVIKNILGDFIKFEFLFKSHKINNNYLWNTNK